jgi:hypothetical protein
VYVEAVMKAQAKFVEKALREKDNDVVQANAKFLARMNHLKAAILDSVKEPPKDPQAFAKFSAELGDLKRVLVQLKKDFAHSPLLRG